MHITEENNLNFGAITQQINTNNKLPQFLVDDLVSFRWKRELTDNFIVAQGSIKREIS
jgi:hypothetical protein